MRRTWLSGLAVGVGIAVWLAWSAEGAAAMKPPKILVEAEEEVYQHTPANNGAGPMWCSGSTCLVRLGDRVFASGLETLPDVPALNNCRWMLFQRGQSGWAKVSVDEAGRTREPCPLVVYQSGRLFLSANPTLVQEVRSGGGPARPEILEFDPAVPAEPRARLKPGWAGTAEFTEHSYRSFAADGAKEELILFQNIGYTHAEYAFLDGAGRWSASGQLKWPWGAEYDQPQPIRVCYPNVALRDGAVYFCGVSDIVEPYNAWRTFKKELTGRDWDYDFRRLFFTWTPDIRQEPFGAWTEIASRDKTAGHIFPADLWLGPEGAVHLLWMERALDERLREKFFPEAKQVHELNYAMLKAGQVVRRQTLVRAEGGGEMASAARWHATPDGRLYVFMYVAGTDPEGRQVSENRLMEVRGDGSTGPAVKVPFKKPFVSFFTATERAGSRPAWTLDLLGVQAGRGEVIAYGRVRGEF